MKKYLSFVLVIGLMTGILSGCGIIGSKNKAIYYESPEALAEDFVEAFNNQDMEIMKQVFGIEIMGENFDYEAMAERLNAMSPQMGVPNDSEFAVEMNRMRYEGQMFSNLRIFIITLNTDIDPFETYGGTDEVDDYIDDFGDYEEIEVMHMYETIIDNDIFEENMEKQAKPYDAEKMHYYILTFEYGHDDYYCGLSMVEYDEGFILESLSCPLVGIGFGTAQPLTDDMQDTLEDEYDEIL